MYCDEECEYVTYSAKSFLYYTLGYNKYHFVFTLQHAHLPSAESFLPPKL